MSEPYHARQVARETYLRRLAWGLLAAFALATLFAVAVVGENGRLREEVAGAKARALFSDRARMLYSDRAAQCAERDTATLSDVADLADRLGRCEDAAAYWADRLDRCEALADRSEASSCPADLAACRTWLGRCEGGFSSTSSPPP